MTTIAATFVFTDLVDSTATAARLGPAAAEQLRQRHFGLLRAPIAASGGVEVKNLGDGVMVMFTSPSRALACAVGMQQAIEHHNRRADEPLAVRIGIGSGEVVEEAGDYFGAPVIEAARLCAASVGGQILTTELFEMLVGRHAAHELRSIGDLNLKGLPDPVAAREVIWEPGTEADAVPIPARLVGAATEGLFGFFGRESQLAEIVSAAKSATDDEGPSLVLIAGEPGIGKTTLAAQACRILHADGAAVAFGATQEGLAVPFGPWIDALGHLVACAPDPIVAAHVDMHGASLARIAPALLRRVPDLAQPPAGDPDTERFLLFEAARSFLSAVAADAPVVVVLDDLHWTDAVSIQLLRHVLASPSGFRLLVVGTYRDTDVARGDPLAGLLADAHRMPNVTRILLDGLSDAEVVELIEAAAGQEQDETGTAFAHALRRETDGNPFFTAELLRHLGETGAFVQDETGRWMLHENFDVLAMPSSIRELVAQRVDRLGERAHVVLSLGAVVGREFDLDTLAIVAEIAEDPLIDLLDQATAAALVIEHEHEPGRYRFAHALIQHTLYQDLSATRRQRAHRRIAEVLELDGRERIAELAHHWYAATRPADAAKALAYTQRAADAALAALAADDAIRWYERALELQTATSGADDRLRCRLLIGLAQAQHLASRPERRATLLAAGHLAARLRNTDLLVDAALAGSSDAGRFVGDDTEYAEIIGAALAAIGPAESVQRARLLCVLAEATDSANWRGRYELATEAIGIARRIADDTTLAVTLNATASYRGLDPIAKRLTDGGLAVTAAGRVGNRRAQCNAWLALVTPALVAGDVELMRRCITEAGDIVERLPLPALRWPLENERSMERLLAGDHAGAEIAAERAMVISSETNQEESLAAYGAALIDIRRHQHRSAEIVDLIADVARANPGIPAVDIALAFILCEVGRHDDARQVYAPHAAARFADMPVDQAWTSGLSLGADVAATLQDKVGAGVLVTLLEPSSTQVAATSVSCQGAIARPLARLETLLAHYDAAEVHFLVALDVHTRLDAPYWIALTQLDYAEMLLARAAPADATQAHDLIAAALAIAQQYDFPGLAARALA